MPDEQAPRLLGRRCETGQSHTAGCTKLTEFDTSRRRISLRTYSRQYQPARRTAVTEHTTGGEGTTN